MIKISKYQLFCLIILLEIGSTTIFALGIEAKNDAWLTILFAMLPAFFFLWVYTELQRYFPGNNLAEIIIKLLGKFWGIPLIILYGQYFLFLSVQVFTEFAELIGMTFLHNTPRIAILIAFMLCVFYFLFLGLEVLGRTSEVIFPVVLFAIISIYIMVAISGEVNLKELQPVLGTGIKPEAVFEVFHVMTFPYGDMLVMLMYWCYLDQKQFIRKISFLAVGISGILLSISVIIIISTLGVDYAASATIPLLEVIKLINIGDILTNLDAIGVVVIFIGGFYKATIHFYGGVLAISTVFKNIQKKWLVAILGIFVLIYGSLLIKSFPFHRWFGIEVVTKYSHPPFQFFIPVILLISYWSKRLNNKI